MSADGTIGPTKRRPRKEAPQFTSDSNEWFTPPQYIEAAREFMGDINLDPASCEAANRIVKAGEFIGVEADGLKQPNWMTRHKGWIREPGSVWINPPSPAKPWWCRLVSEYQAGHVDRFCFLVFNLAQLSPMQRWTPGFHALSPDVLLCLPDHRIRFKTYALDALKKVEAVIMTTEKPSKALLRRRDKLRDTDPNELVDCDQPTRENAFIAVGNAVRFRKAFSRFGAVK